MNSEKNLEDCLDTLGKALRERPQLAERVMEQVRALSESVMKPNDSRQNGVPFGDHTVGGGPAVTDLSVFMSDRSHRRLFVRSFIAATFCVFALALLFGFFPAHSVGWDDVSKAVKKHEWLRRRTKFANGGDGITWFSAVHRIWAYQITDSRDNFIVFADGRVGAKFEYRSSQGKIVRLPLNDDDIHRAMPDGQLTQQKEMLSPWLFSTETVVQKKHRDVEENGKRWIEFDVVYTRTGDSETVRVDPITLLPALEFSRSPKNGEKTHVMEFDFPDEGPSDIYQLGVPRSTRIEDLTPSDDCQKVLAEMAASRAMIGDFRLLVATPSNLVATDPDKVPVNFEWPVFGELFEVWRKGSQWRVDFCQRDRNQRQPQRLKGQNWDAYFEEVLSTSTLTLQYLCDGQTVLENNYQSSARITPSTLLNCGRSGLLDRGISFVSILYPDLSPVSGWGFEFDPAPKDFAEGVLIKISANISNGLTAHEWYYLDRNKGFMVSRVSLFNLPPKQKPTADDAKLGQARIMKGFRKSPQGWWYAAEIEDTSSAVEHGLKELDKKEQDRKARKMIVTTRYFFDFDKQLEDELFRVEKKHE